MFGIQLFMFLTKITIFHDCFMNEERLIHHLHHDQHHLFHGKIYEYTLFRFSDIADLIHWSSRGEVPRKILLD